MDSTSTGSKALHVRTHASNSGIQVGNVGQQNTQDSNGVIQLVNLMQVMLNWIMRMLPALANFAQVYRRFLTEPEQRTNAARNNKSFEKKPGVTGSSDDQKSEQLYFKTVGSKDQKTSCTKRRQNLSAEPKHAFCRVGTDGVPISHRSAIMSPRRPKIASDLDVEDIKVEELSSFAQDQRVHLADKYPCQSNKKAEALLKSGHKNINVVTNAKPHKSGKVKRRHDKSQEALAKNTGENIFRSHYTEVDALESSRKTKNSQGSRNQETNQLNCLIPKAAELPSTFTAGENITCQISSKVRIEKRPDVLSKNRSPQKKFSLGQRDLTRELKGTDKADFIQLLKREDEKSFERKDKSLKICENSGSINKLSQQTNKTLIGYQLPAASKSNLDPQIEREFRNKPNSSHEILTSSESMRKSFNRSEPSRCSGESFNTVKVNIGEKISELEKEGIKQELSSSPKTEKSLKLYEKKEERASSSYTTDLVASYKNSNSSVKQDCMQRSADQSIQCVKIPKFTEKHDMPKRELNPSKGEKSCMSQNTSSNKSSVDSPRQGKSKRDNLPRKLLGKQEATKSPCANRYVSNVIPSNEEEKTNESIKLYQTRTKREVDEKSERASKILLHQDIGVSPPNENNLPCSTTEKDAMVSKPREDNAMPPEINSRSKDKSDFKLTKQTYKTLESNSKSNRGNICEPNHEDKNARSEKMGENGKSYKSTKLVGSSLTAKAKDSETDQQTESKTLSSQTHCNKNFQSTDTGDVSSKTTPEKRRNLDLNLSTRYKKNSAQIDTDMGFCAPNDKNLSSSQFSKIDGQSLTNSPSSCNSKAPELAERFVMASEQLDKNTNNIDPHLKNNTSRLSSATNCEGKFQPTVQSLIAGKVDRESIFSSKTEKIRPASEPIHTKAQASTSCDVKKRMDLCAERNKNIELGTPSASVKTSSLLSIKKEITSKPKQEENKATSVSHQSKVKNALDHTHKTGETSSINSQAETRNLKVPHSPSKSEKDSRLYGYISDPTNKNENSNHEVTNNSGIRSQREERPHKDERERGTSQTITCTKTEKGDKTRKTGSQVNQKFKSNHTFIQNLPATSQQQNRSDGTSSNKDENQEAISNNTPNQNLFASSPQKNRSDDTSSSKDTNQKAESNDTANQNLSATSRWKAKSDGSTSSTNKDMNQKAKSNDTPNEILSVNAHQKNNSDGMSSNKDINQRVISSDTSTQNPSATSQWKGKSNGTTTNKDEKQKIESNDTPNQKLSTTSQQKSKSDGTSINKDTNQKSKSNDTPNQNLSDTSQQENKTEVRLSIKDVTVTEISVSSSPETKSIKHQDSAGKIEKGAQGKKEDLVALKRKDQGSHECEVMNASFDAAEAGIRS